MSKSLLIHFLGFYAVNALMPAWAASADADILAVWYASFALVDAIALMHLDGKGFWRRVNMYGLGTSLAWSVLLMVEMLMLRDTLQPADPTIQRILDVILGLSLIFTSIQFGLVRRRA